MYCQNYNQNYFYLKNIENYLSTTTIKPQTFLPNFIEFKNYVDIARDAYFLLVDRTEFNKGNSIFLYNNLNNNKDPLKDIPKLRHEFDNIKTKHGLDDCQIFYGYQNNIINWYKSVFGFIGKRKDGKGLISIRGTSNVYDWLTNFSVGNTNLNKVPEMSRFSENLVVWSGFLNIYGIDREKSQKVSDVMSAVIDNFASSHPEIEEYIICGHSLGGGVAQICAMHLRLKYNKDLKIILFASPRAYPYDIANYYDIDLKLYNKTFHYFNLYDIVPTIPFPVTDITKTFFDVHIPYLSTVRCFKHVGIHLPLNYLPDEITKDFRFIPDCHTIDKAFLPYMDIWNQKVIDNNITYPPTYKNFQFYSELLDYIYNKSNFLHSKNASSITMINKDFFKGKNITNLFPLFSTKDNWILSDTNCLVGLVGTINIEGKNKCILMFGVDYEKFPIDLKYTDIIGEFLETSKFDNLENLKQFATTSIIDIFKKLYFTNSCENNMCIKSCLDQWLIGKNINDFIIISQNAGSCFALITALYLHSLNKNVEEVYMYSPSKLGNNLFAKEYNKILGNKTYSFINLQDTYELYMPFFSGTFDYLTKSMPISVFSHCGEIFCLDEQPIASGTKFVCQVSLLTSVRNPRSYKDIHTWKKILEKSY